MAKLDPYKLAGGLRRLETLQSVLKRSGKPRIGVTQGGSSRKDAGAKVAAKNVTQRHTHPKTEK